jgi:hypothetical protein
MKNMFMKLADQFKDNQDLVDFFTGWATGNRYGTGWVFVDNDGSNYILTNRHVAEQAERIDFTLEDENGSTRGFKNCPILYIDKDIDLAVAQFPKQENVFQRSFALNMDKQPDGKQVFSAGYPGLLREGSSWQLAPGAITNFQARIPEFIDPEISTTIQHSAPIDHGSSGGPLLLPNDKSPLGFDVVGVNTAIARENTFLAIPSKAIRMVLDNAKRAKTIRASQRELTSQLEKDCNILADELATETPSAKRLMSYISYAFVGTEDLGWSCFTLYLSSFSNKQDRDALLKEFENDPIGVMREAVFYAFIMEMQLRAKVAGVADLSSFSFQRINSADVQNIKSDASGQVPATKTWFNLGGTTRVELSWVFEYGDWRLGYMKFQYLNFQPTPRKTTFNSSKEFSQSYTTIERNKDIEVNHAWIGTDIHELTSDRYLVTLYDENQKQFTTSSLSSEGLNAIINGAIARAVVDFFKKEGAKTDTIYKVSMGGQINSLAGGYWGFMIDEIKLLAEDDSVVEDFH